MIREIFAFASVATSMLTCPALAAARALPADPLNSPMWEYQAERLFGDAPVIFDDRVKLVLPMIAEDQHVVPVSVDARALGAVKRILIFADLNPIPVAIEYRPLRAEPFVETRIKLDQRTPVRAAVELADGSWHVAAEWIDAAGGGCSAPPVSRARGDWADHLGEMRGGAWPDARATRLRVSIRHPMDTGLVENIPAYNVERLTVVDTAGKALADMNIYGAVAEDPAFTLLVKEPAPVWRVSARDTNGLEFSGSIRPAAETMLAPAGL